MADETGSTTDARSEQANGEVRAGSGGGRRRWPLLAGLGVIVLVVLGVAAWWFVLRDDSPEEADADTARETLADADADAGADAGDAAPGDENEGDATGGATEDGADPIDSVNGTWSVDTSIGSFDHAAEDFSGTWAGYRIQEELASVGGATAVGRTPDVSGTVGIEDGTVTSVSFEVDMTTLESDEGFRDDRLASQGLETDTYPTASFELLEPFDLPEDAASGETLSYDASGELTLHGETREIELELDAFLEDDAIGVVASAPIVLDDYNIDKPSSPAVVGMADEGEFELQAFLTLDS